MTDSAFPRATASSFMSSTEEIQCNWAGLDLMPTPDFRTVTIRMEGRTRLPDIFYITPKDRDGANFPRSTWPPKPMSGAFGKWVGGYQLTKTIIEVMDRTFFKRGEIWLQIKFPTKEKYMWLQLNLFNCYSYGFRN